MSSCDNFPKVINPPQGAHANAVDKAIIKNFVQDGTGELIDYIQGPAPQIVYENYRISSKLMNRFNREVPLRIQKYWMSHTGYFQS